MRHCHPARLTANPFGLPDSTGEQILFMEDMMNKMNKVHRGH